MNTIIGPTPWATTAPQSEPVEPALLRWYVVQTIRGREKFAEENLERQGISNFLPLFSRPARRRRLGFVGGVEAFFPGYLFVSLPPASPLWRSVAGTYGVAKIVRFGERPAAAPLGFVEDMIRRTGPDGVLGFVDELSLGDRVRVVGGAFDQLYGNLRAMEPHDRVVVLLQVMGREVPVRMSRRSLMRAHDEPVAV